MINDDSEEAQNNHNNHNNNNNYQSNGNYQSNSVDPRDLIPFEVEDIYSMRISNTDAIIMLPFEMQVRRIHDWQIRFKFSLSENVEVYFNRFYIVVCTEGCDLVEVRSRETGMLVKSLEVEGCVYDSLFINEVFVAVASAEGRVRIWRQSDWMWFDIAPLDSEMVPFLAGPEELCINKLQRAQFPDQLFINVYRGEYIVNMQYWLVDVDQMTAELEEYYSFKAHGRYWLAAPPSSSSSSSSSSSNDRSRIDGKQWHDITDIDPFSSQHAAIVSTDKFKGFRFVKLDGFVEYAPARPLCGFTPNDTSRETDFISILNRKREIHIFDLARQAVVLKLDIDEGTHRFLSVSERFMLVLDSSNQMIIHDFMPSL